MADCCTRVQLFIYVTTLASDCVCSYPQWEHKLPEEDPETDIVKMQNDLDYENSERCFAKAYATRKGYSCHATKYISWFYKQVIGSETLYVPACPGDEEYEQKKGKK